MDSVIISNTPEAHELTEPMHGLIILTIEVEGQLYTVARQTYRHEILNIEALEELFEEAQNV